MKNLPKEKRDQLILVIVGVILITAAAWYFVINYQKETLVSYAKKIREEESRVNNAQRLAQSITTIKQALQESTRKLGTIEKTMAHGDMYSWLYTTVSEFRKRHPGVDVPQFSREVQCEVGVLPKFPYRAAAFNLRGTAFFHDFGAFVADFENTFPYMRIQNIELDPASTSAATSSDHSEKLSFRMEIVALVSPTGS